MRPPDAITHADAPPILGVHTWTVARMIERGELRSHRTKPCLSRRLVEAVAELRRRFRMDVTSAASHLGVATSPLRRWLEAGIVPGHRSTRGRWWLDSETSSGYEPKVPTWSRAKRLRRSSL